MPQFIALVAIILFSSWLSWQAILLLGLALAVIIYIAVKWPDFQASDSSNGVTTRASPITKPSDDLVIQINFRGRDGSQLSSPHRRTAARHPSTENGAQGATSIGRDANAEPTSGLIIKPAPLEKILSGAKSWEMRSKATSKRGRVALIEKGGKRILGVATIIDVHGPLTFDTMMDTVSLHGISEDRLRSGETEDLRYAWILADVKRLPQPVAYRPRNGPVTFVNLDHREQAEIAAQLR